MCMFCRSLFVLFFFFFLPLCCLSFDVRILFTSLVSSNSSYTVFSFVNIFVLKLYNGDFVILYLVIKRITNHSFKVQGQMPHLCYQHHKPTNKLYRKKQQEKNLLYQYKLCVCFVDRCLSFFSFTDKLYHIILYWVHLAWARFELTTLVVMGTYCIGSYSNVAVEKRNILGM
jgi:hypothetical protein